MTRVLLLVLALVAAGLVGLLVGQVVVVLVRLLARVALAPSGRGGLAGFVLVRRLARAGDATRPLRLVVAAGTVAVVAATGVAQAAAWVEETARLRTGGPARVLLPDVDPAAALRLTAELDPEGRHLVAAALLTSQDGTGDGSSGRRAYLDLRRVDQVLRDWWTGSPVAPAVPYLHDLVEAPVVNTGPTLTVGVRGVAPRAGGTIDPIVQVEYVDPTGGTTSANVVLALPLDGSQVTGTIGLPGCGDGECTLTRVTGSRRAGDATDPWVIDRIDFGDRDVLVLDWVASEVDSPPRPGGLQQVDHGLLARTTTRDLSAVPDLGPVALVATETMTWAGPPTARLPDGGTRDAIVVTRAPALPLVEADGVVLDLSTVLTGSSGSSASVSDAGEPVVSVVAGPGTPPALLARLERATGGKVETVDDVGGAVAREAGVVPVAAGVVVAAGCLGVALLALAAASGRQRLTRRRDDTALLDAGVAADVVRTATWLELAALALAAALGTAVGGLLAVRLLLPYVVLARVPEHAVALTTSVSVPLLASGAVGAALLVLVAGARRGSEPG